MAHTSSPRRRGGTRQAHSSTPYHQYLEQPRVNARDTPQKTNPLPYGTLLRKIENETISRASAEPKITGCKYLASYSWLDKPTPTILIPGKPPAWTPPVTAQQLKPDTGEYFRDPNAARYAAHPIQPAVQAVLHQNPKFVPHDVDIFTCSSVLGKLSKFVCGGEHTFRFIMEAVGNTVFFVRREDSPTLFIPNVRGFGHNFIDEYTTWDADVKGSTSHQRIIQYKFGGLRFAVRFQSDCYHKKGKTKNKAKHTSGPLLDAFADTSINATKLPDESALRFKEGGRAVRQSDVCDIKTRYMRAFATGAIRKEVNKTDVIPRLWVSQIPTLIAAFHDKGVFGDIRKQDVRKELAAWESDHENSLRQLATLLEILIDTAMESNTPLEVCRSATGPLEIRLVVGEDSATLPPKLKAIWAGGVQKAKHNGPKHALTCEPEANLIGLDEDTDYDWDYTAWNNEDKKSPLDYTACDAEDCGYCGHCKY